MATFSKQCIWSKLTGIVFMVSFSGRPSKILTKQYAKSSSVSLSADLNGGQFDEHEMHSHINRYFSASKTARSTRECISLIGSLQ